LNISVRGAEKLRFEAIGRFVEAESPIEADGESTG
jgi:hypothetical protein